MLGMGWPSGEGVLAAAALAAAAAGDERRLSRSRAPAGRPATPACPPSAAKRRARRGGRGMLRVGSGDLDRRGRCHGTVGGSCGKGRGPRLQHDHRKVVPLAGPVLCKGQLSY
eukprot:19168-Chlamydomonas_euryale.AAC.5